MDGILNIYKEKGFTSHDVVAKLRGILKMKRIGHTGTLDPAAEGVLPVCLGTATRLCDLLTDKVKAYRAEIVFGVATDTEDMTGQIIKELQVSCKEEELRSTIVEFIGTYEQIPPMYSAIKVEGKKLYELAREGKVIERQGRPVTIYSIDVEQIICDENGDLKEATIVVVCGKGTYIRSLCRDIGERLSTCACMKSLVRIKSGQFELAESLKLSEVEALRDEGVLSEHIVTVEQVFASCGKIKTKEETDKLLKNGNKMSGSALLEVIPGQKDGDFPANWYRAYTSNESFLGVYEKKKADYVPVKMFL
ncbi:MAG: tRNA pseudouridine(55) synthase TruB [Lachnospiraceae bacterium]|nr:tRNA pseudouridine(55) synthase TruB [Lachnospiraceae bacterium]